MSAENLVLAFAFGWGAWMLYRIHQRRQSRSNSTGAIVETPSKAKPREMPRVGTPGSISFNQTQELKRNHFQPDKNWSREEAALILDSVKYLRAVCRDIAGGEDGPPPIDIQNEVLRFILTEQDIREYVRKWGIDRRAAGARDYDDEDEPELARNNQYQRVADRARPFLDPVEAEPEAN
jgi:hypothetical protein